MKKLFFCSLIASTVLVSCSKEWDHPDARPAYNNSQSVTIDAAIASGAEYQLDLQPYADADDIVSIKTQAVNYTTSAIVNSGGGRSPVYHFSAVTSNKLPFSEKVVIAVTGRSNESNYGGGCNSNNDYTSNNYTSNSYTLITINIKVQ